LTDFLHLLHADFNGEQLYRILLKQIGHYLPPVSMTPVANLPPVLLIPAANYHRRQITTGGKQGELVAKFATGVADTGGKFATGVVDTGDAP
jgi:hypothetical protein